MKILLLAENNSYESNRLKEEAEKKGHQLDQLKFSALTFHFTSQNCEFLVNGEKQDLIAHYDTFFIRSSKSSEGHRYKGLTGLFRELVHSAGKPILNLEFGLHHSNPSVKIYTYGILSSQGIPIIETYVFNTFKQFELSKDNLIFPLIAKESTGSHGEGVALIKDLDQLYMYFMSRSIDQILLQEFIDSPTDERSDIRVLIVGKKIMGAFERYTTKDRITTNYSTGGDIRKFELTQEVIDISNKLIEIFKIEFAGIDFIFKDGKPYVLEINRSPQFKGFETITGVNVAESLIDFITSPS